MRTQPKFPLPQPQPATPIRGAGLVPITFQAYVDARLGKPVAPAVARLYRQMGAYKCKPKRNSVGIIFQGRAYWWSSKGFYRPGFSQGPRQPLHHAVWEHLHGRKMPARFEVFFRDRDYHNFTKPNLELLSKADCRKRIVEIGENKQISLAQRQQISIKRWTRHGAQTTGFLLSRFNAGVRTVAATLPKELCSQSP
ncbi:MAG: hypothetical protein E6R03_16500 [Hyphomicrobiaceae bacterium]|nr:MAG: hypothetical protein E6R03_16500 [Hyphomicrobiaceae bacterium]